MAKKMKPMSDVSHFLWRLQFFQLLSDPVSSGVKTVDALSTRKYTVGYACWEIRLRSHRTNLAILKLFKILGSFH